MRTFQRLVTPRAVLALVVVAAVGITVDTYRSISHTWDEPAHLANGLLLLDSGQYIEYQHPPLARLATAIGPYLGGSRAQAPDVLPVEFVDRILDSFNEGRRILYQTGASYDTVLSLSRAGILPFLVVLIVATYAWTRTLLSEWGAVLAASLVATTPIILGNAGISTLDLPFTALGIASLAVYCRWLERPTIGGGVLLGAVTGAAIMAKFSAIPFLGLCFTTLALWYGWRHTFLFISRPHIKAGLAAFGALLVVCWLTYGGGLVSIADPVNRPYQRVDALFAPGTLANRVVSGALELKVIPYFVWGIKEGIQDVSLHNQGGHLSYLLGERGEDGWWNYYLVGLAVRTPLPLLAAGVLGLALLLRSSVRTRRWQLGAPAVAFVTLLAFASIYSRINLGIRHILILYPLLAIGGAATAMAAFSSVRFRPVAVPIAIALLVSQIVSVAIGHPDHVSYFNAIAGSHPERFLITADLDWGQDMKRLETELRARGIKQFALSFYGSNDLARHDLPGYSALQPNTPQQGWIAISLWRLYRNDDFSWLRGHEPVARIGRSINLYYIDAGTQRPAGSNHSGG